MQQVGFKCNNDVDALLSVRCVTVMLQIARAHGQREGERGIGIIRNVGKRQQILVFVGYSLRTYMCSEGYRGITGVQPMGLGRTEPIPLLITDI